MIIAELKCPDCGYLQLFHAQDFEDGAYCKKCQYSNEAWQFPHRFIVAIDDNYHITDMTDLKWYGISDFSEEGEYPYYNDTLELNYNKFIDSHGKEWSKRK